MALRYRTARLEDIPVIASTMRAADVAECAAHGRSPEFSLRVGFLSSEICNTIETDGGQPVAMGGVASDGQVWLLASEDIGRNKLAFLRMSRPYLASLAGRYDMLFAYTHAANKVHHEWLRWCGFHVINTYRLPPYDEAFHEVVKLCATAVSSPSQPQL